MVVLKETLKSVYEPFPNSIDPGYYTANFEKTIDYKIRRKRISILKDALKQLEVRKLTSGTYCFFDAGAKTKKSLYGDLKPRIKDFEKNCRVCALGNLFVSKVKLYNEYSLTRNNNCIHQSYGSYYYISLYGDDIRKNLNPYFAREQLDLIESAFERTQMINCKAIYGTGEYNHINNYLNEAVIFGESYTDENEYDAASAPTIMRAIIENMLRNNGIFIPGDVQ